MVDLGHTLRGLRLAKGYTQQQVAELVGVTKGGISAYETGIRQPSFEILLKLASLYKVSTDFLLGNEEAASDFSLDSLTPEQIETVLKIIHDFHTANELI